MRIKNLIKNIFKAKKSIVLVKDLVKGERYRCKKWVYGLGGLYIREGTIVIYMDRRFGSRFRIEDTGKIFGVLTSEVEKYMEECK